MAKKSTKSKTEKKTVNAQSNAEATIAAPVTEITKEEFVQEAGANELNTEGLELNVDSLIEHNTEEEEIKNSEEVQEDDNDVDALKETEEQDANEAIITETPTEADMSATEGLMDSPVLDPVTEETPETTETVDEAPKDEPAKTSGPHKLNRQFSYYWNGVSYN